MSEAIRAFCEEQRFSATSTTLGWVNGILTSGKLPLWENDGTLRQVDLARSPETLAFLERWRAELTAKIEARPAIAVPSPSAPAAPCPSPQMGEGR